jgi:hypothetical protein
MGGHKIDTIVTYPLLGAACVTITNCEQLYTGLSQSGRNRHTPRGAPSRGAPSRGAEFCVDRCCCAELCYFPLT